MSNTPGQFTTTRRVEFCDTDMAGIVHFSTFYKWMEQAEHDYFRSLNLSIVTPTEDGGTFGWPRVMAKCRFESPAKYDDVIELRLKVTRRGVKSLTYSCEFWCGETRLATGDMKTVACKVRPGEKLTSVEIPSHFDAIQACE
jgi:YbgC/YbaW family acyl-CoA thioester hydrolase